MWPVNLVEKTSRLKEYIKNLISEVNEFEQSLDNITVTAMRKSAIDEVEYAYKKVLFEMEEEKRFSYSSEIRIGSGYTEDTFFLKHSTIPTYLIDTFDDFEIGEGVITVRLNIFNQLIPELISSIQKGELDDKIHFTANHLIYNKIYEAATTKTEPEIQLVAGVFIDENTLEGKLVSYACPHCKALVLAPYSKIDRELVCVKCSKPFYS